MRRVGLLVVISCVSVVVCAQAGSLTPEERSEFKSLHMALLRIENDLVNSHDELIRQSQDNMDCIPTLRAIKMMDCLSSLENDASEIYNTVHEVSILAELSESMVSGTDEARIGSEVLRSIRFGIKRLSVEKNYIQARNCYKFLTLDSTQLLLIVDRSTELLNSVKRHFEH